MVFSVQDYSDSVAISDSSPDAFVAWLFDGGTGQVWAFRSIAAVAQYLDSVADEVYANKVMQWLHAEKDHQALTLNDRQVDIMDTWVRSVTPPLSPIPPWMLGSAPDSR